MADDQDLTLTVWFDGQCGLCTRIAAWIERQPKFVPVHCAPAQSAGDAGCPISPQALLDKLTVTASDGAVYHGTNAWLTVLWGLRNYRGWSLWLSRDAWRPWAEHLFAIVTGLAKRTRRATTA
ncbi:MAG: DUF393 domain-containing protein [Planctomycetes bacterium]|nr:DUF393 domain-containing protein [Planctomycetota bacterium]